MGLQHLPPAVRSSILRQAAHASWAQTEDRSARTLPGRRAFLERFERQVDPEGLLSPEERGRRAASALRSYMTALRRRRTMATKKPGHPATAAPALEVRDGSARPA